MKLFFVLVYCCVDMLMTSCFAMLLPFRDAKKITRPQPRYSAGTMTEFSWRRESSLTTSGSLKMDSCLVLTECLSRRILHIIDRLNPLRKSVEFDIRFLVPPPGVRFTCVHDNTKVLVSRKRDKFSIFRAFT